MKKIRRSAKKIASGDVAVKERPNAANRKDYVGKSGVYPMSGPLPPGNARIRGQMEWGQGTRGAAGYEDHGGSELYFESGNLLGGFDANEAYPALSGEPRSRTVCAPEWMAFSKWLTHTFNGLVSTLELVDPDGNNVIEVRERPFAGLLARVLGNGVTALTLVFDFPPQRTLYNLTGPRSMTVQHNASGFPTRVTIGYTEGEAILHFNSEPIVQQKFTGNSWGE